MADFIIVVVLLLIVGGAAAYIIKEKKRGTVCIGCPHAGECAKKELLKKEKVIVDNYLKKCYK